MTTKQNMSELKSWLKKTAEQIKAQKKEYKQKQRENTDTWQDRVSLKNIRRKYRHYHIAYSQLRGKTRDQIERTVREGNEPDEDMIQAIVDAITQDQESNNEQVVCADQE